MKPGPSQCAKFIPGILGILLLLLSCKKTDDEEKPLINLSGKAVYVSPALSKTDTVAISGQVVTAVDSLTGTPYRLVTDSQGFFLLPGWKNNSIFNLSTKQAQNDDNNYKVVFSAKSTVIGDQLRNASLVATVDTTDYKTLLLTAKDIYGGGIPGAKILIYTSRAVATADTGFVGYNATVKLLTGPSGKCLAMQLPDDTLFIKGFYKADTVLNVRSKILPLRIKNRYADTSITLQ